MKLDFSKMHGLGNDFVIINNLQLQHNFTASEIKFIGDRKFGIGCDQILIIDPADDGTSDFYYKIFNSDGSIAGQCGNGARCFIRYVVDHGLTTKKQIKLQTTSRIISGQLITPELIEVDMGVPEFRVGHIPLLLPQTGQYQLEINHQTLKFSALSMGNPHAVINLLNPQLLEDDNYLQTIAQTLQQASYFPESVNVNFVYIVDNSLIKLRTYERGCGFTLACGSGACASAAALIKQNLVHSTLTVQMDGGELNIDWSRENLLMRGAAVEVFNGTIELCAN
ncbi:MAG: diaminopimelate epimerase [Neisseriaceae bacterium]|nr:MAG: diaminopimelate epimerase [Neisseriaceae bacterium]